MKVSDYDSVSDEGCCVDYVWTFVCVCDCVVLAADVSVEVGYGCA